MTEINTKNKYNQYFPTEKEKAMDFRAILQEYYDTTDDNGELPTVYRDDLKSFSKKLNKNADKLPRLYHYSAVNYYNLRNLEKGRIHFSGISQLNDCYEGIPQLKTDKGGYSVDDYAFVTCFSEDRHNSVMWGHYGDKTRGMCIEYDLNLLQGKERSALNYLFPVVYSNRRYKDNYSKSVQYDLYKYLVDSADRTNIICEEDYDFLRETVPALLVKGEDWSYEKEWRIALNVLEYDKLCSEYWDEDENGCIPADNMPDIENHLMSFDCVSAVYLGVRIDNDKRDCIREIVERINQRRSKESRQSVSVYQGKLSENSFTLEFDKLC